MKSIYSNMIIDKINLIKERIDTLSDKPYQVYYTKEQFDAILDKLVEYIESNSIDGN